MANFQIPPRVISGFDVLLKVGDEDINKICEVLENMPVGVGPNAFLNIISNKLSFLKDITDLGRTLFSFGNLLLIEDSTNNLANNLADSFNETRDSKLSSEEVSKLSLRLEKIFNSAGNLKLTHKAVNLLGENDHIYVESKVVTDIRLIFNDSLHNSKRHASIFHSLKIKYEKDNSKKDFFVSLDYEDLNELKRQIERALEKESVIKDDYKGILSFINIGN